MLSSAEECSVSPQLRWTMTREVKDGGEKRQVRFDFDLTSLTNGYSPTFLFAIKSALIETRNHVSLLTIHTNYKNLKSILSKCQESRVMNTVVEKIDLAFLAALEAVMQELTKASLDALARFFKIHRGDAMIFASDLRPGHFPRFDSGVGPAGEAIKRILSLAMSRATMTEILTTVEEAYESKQIDIGHYSFAMLAFHVYFRPESYRQLRLMDLVRDEDKATGAVNWFLDMLPVKTRIENPSRLSIKITRSVGELLKLQQKHVVDKYGHLVSETDLRKLALFPARQLKADGTWKASYANQNNGMCADSTAFSRAYLKRIEALVNHDLSFNALRHTVGTQLALAGLSASSIAAVLRHATDETCQRYVDLFFKGTLDKISEAVQPSFDEHFPIYKDVLDRAISQRDPIPREKAIVSEDLRTGRREVTAECGRQSLCGYAPLACYDCDKFRPCWDADHTINLDLVNREIADFEGQGLALQHEVSKYKRLRNAIHVVIFHLRVEDEIRK